MLQHLLRIKQNPSETSRTQNGFTSPVAVSSTRYGVEVEQKMMPPSQLPLARNAAPMDGSPRSVYHGSVGQVPHSGRASPQQPAFTRLYSPPFQSLPHGLHLNSPSRHYMANTPSQFSHGMRMPYNSNPNAS